MKKWLFAIVVILAVGGIVYLVIPSSEDEAKDLDQARTEEAREVKDVEASAADVVFDLSAKNTKIGFSCAKDVAGKTATVRGGWSDRFGSKLTGNVIIDRDRKIQRLEAEIDVGSLWSEHDSLTEALLTKGFFQAQQHPTATFVSTDIQVGASETSTLEGATHVIEGNLQINGIEKSIAFPAKLKVSDSEVSIESRFSLNRKDFNVNFTDSAGFGLLTDENISNLVALSLTVAAESSAAGESTTSVAATDSAPDESGTTDGAVDVSQLPPTYTETVPSTQVTFDMVLVPGDDAAGIAPLYFGKHEVTWNDFMPWVDGRDLENEEEMGELRALKLRPSPPYGSVDRNFGMQDRPALGVSRLSAEMFCKWLSEQTGKTYRLPTEQEWEHAYQMGGGNPAEAPPEAEAKQIAVYKDNSWSDSVFDWSTEPVGSKEPNRLGIHDMAGNVAEWVTETGDERVVRGGHFEAGREELGVGRYVEDPDWNRDDPSEPKSIWWLVNARWVGFRVVCEVTE